MIFDDEGNAPRRFAPAPSAAWDHRLSGTPLIPGSGNISIDIVRYQKCFAASGRSKLPLHYH